jgi:CheY-like chemotaxis protein
MATLLVVDDDKNFLLSLADGLRSYENKFEVLTAENGKEAVAVLKSHKVDLLITDLKMPEMDGFELLAHMVPHYPQIPVIVMTAFSTPEMEDHLMNMGTFMFLEKPLDFNVLVEKISQGMEAGSHYFTKVLSLCSFLQTLEHEKKTCTVSIRSGEREGNLYFLNGALIEGETGDMAGAEAIYNIVSWEAAEVELDGNIKQDTRALDKPFNFIIREEQNRHTQQFREERSGGAEPGGNGETSSKEMTMNLGKLSEAMEVLKKDMGKALVGAGIVSRADARIILDYNAHPKTSILFSQFTKYLKRILSDCSMPSVGKYYLIDLEGNKAIIALPLKDYEWGIILDLTQVTLGLFLNVTLPKILNAFEGAVNS